MKVIVNLLFPHKEQSLNSSILLLGMRIIFGALFLNHGIQKAMNFETLSATFPDPLGVGSEFSLILAIFGEVACSILFILGLFHRLALIPMMVTMLVAFFIIHGADPFAVKELALVYLVVFAFMWLAGPGRFSADHSLGKLIRNKLGFQEPQRATYY